MVMTTHVDIVSAEEEIFSGSVEMIFAPAEMGEVGIAPRHTQMITRLKPGEVRLQTGGEEQSFYVSGGILEVQPHVVTVLADTAIRARDLDEAQAIKAKEKAEQALKDKASDLDYTRAQIELAEAAAQIRTIEKLRKMKK
ncbi:MAG TPA: F0F1 ATP synthase subunit epsilon [Gammaproteobacteria bacterium]|mgnify:CR=1 FL=1|nr:F0F1 ATP synthase subunit epsilon [Gammaproteobacteria bacterium]